MVDFSFLTGPQSPGLYASFAAGRERRDRRELVKAQTAEAQGNAREKQLGVLRSFAYNIKEERDPALKQQKFARFQEVAPVYFPDMAGQFQSMTLADIDALSPALTTPEQALDMGKTQAEIANEQLRGGLITAQTDDQRNQSYNRTRSTSSGIAVDGAQIRNIDDTITDRRNRFGLDATKAQVTGYGQVPEGQLRDPATGNVADMPGAYRKPPSSGGNVSVDPVTGALTVGAPPKLTEAQGKDIYYLNRMRAVADKLDKAGGALTGYWSANAGSMPGIGNAMKTDDYRMAEQLGREFLASVLRKETGAAITADEWSYYGPLYLPVPGDDDATIERKREARRVAMQGVEAGLGPAIGAMPQGMPGSGILRPGAGGPQVGQTEDGFRFRGGDPSDPANWEPAQ